MFRESLRPTPLPRPYRPSRLCRLLSAGILVVLLSSAPLLAQERRALDHDDYDRWNRIQQSGLSADGAWLRYRIVPGEGDGILHIVQVDGATHHRVERGTAPAFTADNRFAIFRIEPHSEDEDQEPEAEEGAEPPAAAEPAAVAEPSAGANREGARGGGSRSEAPSDSVGILDLTTGAVVYRDRVRGLSVPSGSTGWIAIHRVAPPREGTVRDRDAEETPEAAAEQAAPAAGDAAPAARNRRRPEGTDLLWFNVATGEERVFPKVTEFRIRDDGTEILMVVSSADGNGGATGGQDGIFHARIGDTAPTPLLAGVSEVARLVTDETWTKAAFLSNRDSWEDEDPEHALFVADLTSDRAARVVAAPGATGLPADWIVSTNGTVRFSDSGERLFFGTAPRPLPEPDEEDEQLQNVKVDIWSWHDDFLQPHQLVDLNGERRRTYEAVAHLESGTLVQLEDPTLLSVSVADGGNGSVALGQDDRPYRQRVSWDTRYVDVYLVDPTTGARERILEDLRGSASLSPTGRYIYWWDGDTRSWMVMDSRDRSIVRATRDIPHPVFNELDDRPGPPGSLGIAGWTEDDARMVVHDAWDLWSVDPAGADAPRNLTAGYGRENEIRLRINWLGDERTIRPGESLLLSAFHHPTKAAGFYRAAMDGSAPERVILDDVAFGGLEKAEEADRFLYTRRTFRDFPDLWVSDTSFRGERRLTEANPQQAEYSWGTAELVDWTSTDGETLQGILYRPDDFDPTRKYPMMVYFYERSSNSLHNYQVPSAGTSINRSFYVSRGYLLFEPDIPYREGYPGESAMNAVIPGILSLVEEGFVDRDRIGVQGHSWGGYQIAYMLTRTNLFAAAEAGAPVTNMTSAYGGIRWESGRVRQMQYERGQSRIGATLWEAQHRYIENSPLFTAYKVETPLLMLHNDEDGAVPWEEGIQFFVALRRLNRPVWLLNYNGEAHGLRQAHNQRDWAIRMQQFFDHYLIDAPPPVWMVDGVPAVAKGRTLGLELVQPVVDNGAGGASGGGGG